MTKNDRNRIYTLALQAMGAEKFKGSDLLGMCAAIDDAIHSLHGYFPTPYGSLNRYPEIFKHEPKKTFGLGYWFERGDPTAYDKRIVILKQAIKETL